MKILVEKAVIEQALKALETDEQWGFVNKKVLERRLPAITALREALAEQAEQEPDYFGLTHDHTWLSIDKKQYDKLKPEGRMACYAAPVRTKDLTDDEAQKLWHDTSSIVPMWAHHLHFARAVIAADRSKNGIV